MNKSRCNKTTLRQITYGLSLLLIPCVAGAAEPSAGNRWIKKSQQEGTTALQRRVYQQLAKLPDCKLEGGFAFAFMPKATNPLAVLRNMGFDALPILVEALDDSTPTKTVNLRGNRGNYRTFPKSIVPLHFWKVNELAARLIRLIADREFIFEEGEKKAYLSDIESHRDRIPKFQKQITEWYEQNKRRTPEERKLADLQSNFSEHSRNAAAWLGKRKSLKAVPLLVKRIETILGGKEKSSSTHQAELATLSLALGRIGDNKGFPAVKKACDHLSYCIYMSYRPPQQGRSSALELHCLFRVYNGMALLGHKNEAIAELKRLYEKYGPEMYPSTRAKYQRLLREAAKWCPGKEKGGRFEKDLGSDHD